MLGLSVTDTSLTIGSLASSGKLDFGQLKIQSLETIYSPFEFQFLDRS